MKVSKCKRCIYSIRKRYSTYHTPRNYHAIGISHAYYFCELLQKRCLDIKKSECKKEEVNNND